MTLSRKIGLELLVGVAALLLLSQAVEFVQARKAHRDLAKSSLELLQQRELQQVENFYSAVEHNLTAATSRGDMDEFERVGALQKEAPDSRSSRSTIGMGESAVLRIVRRRDGCFPPNSRAGYFPNRSA